MASGRFTTEADRQGYLRMNPTNHRVLKRWEVENYLFDKEVLSKYCHHAGLAFDEEGYDANVRDIVNEDVKSQANSIKSFCGLSTNANTENFKIELAKLITSDMAVFVELENCIFSRQ